MDPPGNPNDFQNWNKLPQRMQLPKQGTGFSKILATLKVGGVGGGGSSVLGTARHLLNESNASNNTFQNTLQQNLDDNVLTGVEISRFSTLMNATAPNFNNNVQDQQQYNTHEGSYSARTN